MAITTTWKVNNMVHNTDNGGVITVYWECVAQADTGESAVEAGKYRCEPDPSSPDYVAYADLTEETVLGWIYNSLIEGEETAEEAKARIEANRTGKVEAQIARKTAQASGTPWATE
jgi:hypothetical protein